MPPMADAPDFESEGLLDGVDGPERESRLELLERSARTGVGLEELRHAVRGLPARLAAGRARARR